jgi:ribosomal protein S18 acetylase RimI-like enzyme
MSSLTQACAALVEALLDDPFYVAITEGLGNDPGARRRALTPYFQYSLEEAQRTGRCILAPDPSLGAAAWLLPCTHEVKAAESAAKSKFLPSALGERGAQNYYSIVRYMAPLAARVVPPGAWYLSIIGIQPSAQGRGLGAALLTDTLKESSEAGATCYLETFTPRNLKFYERVGFRRVAEHHEPTTDRDYVVMRRDVAA